MPRLLSYRVSHFFSVVLLLCLHNACGDGTTRESPCVPQNRSVTLPKRVRLLFAGYKPIFMREVWNPDSERRFLSDLSGVIRHHATQFQADETPFSRHIPKRAFNSCSVLEVSYAYSIAFAEPSMASKLDSALSAALKSSSSMFASGPEVADSFSAILAADPAFAPSNDAGTYNLLVYNAASVAPERGYIAGQGTGARTTGIATSTRFAFIDVGANPHFMDNSATFTPGEQLMAVSRESQSYAIKLREIAMELFTPSASRNMRRFPRESRLFFSLKLIDVSAVIGRISGVAGDSMGNKRLGSTFNAGRFEGLIQSVLHGPVTGEKRVSIEVEEMNVARDPSMPMALVRAFSMKGLEMELDSDQLLRDILENKERGGYFVDASFVAHVPMFLFSFADDSRITHFKTGQNLRAMVAGKSAVFMIENRLRDSLEEIYATTTSEAAKEVLELLCGVTRHELGYMNASKGSVPLLLGDIVRLNILRQEIDWSEVNAARKAVDLLTFEGLDPRLIPHDKGSAIAESRMAVRTMLDALYRSWDKAVASLSVEGIENASLDLVSRSKELEDQLHDEICNQPLSEEILLKVEAETEDEMGPESHITWSMYVVYGLLPAIVGSLFGAFCHRRVQKKTQARSATLGEIPISSPRHTFVPPSTGLWFSTLTSSDKPKTH